MWLWLHNDVRVQTLFSSLFWPDDREHGWPSQMSPPHVKVTPGRQSIQQRPDNYFSEGKYYGNNDYLVTS